MPSTEEAVRLLQLARDAHARGDSLLQLQIDVAQLTGTASTWGSAENGLVHEEDVGYFLSGVEKIGWRLEHTGYVFVAMGSTSSERMFRTGQGLVNHGGIEGMFTFRRV